MKGSYDLPYVGTYWVTTFSFSLKKSPLLVYFALEETSAGLLPVTTEAPQSWRLQSLRKNSGGLDDNNISQTSGWVTRLGLIPKNSDSCRSYCKDRCSRNLFPSPLPWQPAFHRLQHGKGGYKEISQLELLRWLTLQYSLIGPSLFMATSLIWLLLNRIFPGSTDTDVSKRRRIIFHIVGSICHVIKTVKTFRAKKSKC